MARPSSTYATRLSVRSPSNIRPHRTFNPRRDRRNKFRTVLACQAPPRPVRIPLAFKASAIARWVVNPGPTAVTVSAAEAAASSGFHPAMVRAHARPCALSVMPGTAAELDRGAV